MFSKLKYTFALCLLCAAPSFNAFAQQGAASPAAPSPEAQLLRTLIDEVRQLRVASQRNSLNLHRAQTLTDRMARQQTRVESLAEEIEQLKTQVQQSLDTSRDEDEMKELEAAINDTADTQQRAVLIQSYNGMKRAIERQREYARQEAERSRSRQQQLEIALRAEQSKLAELQDQFDALEREFEKQLNETRKPR